MNERYNLLLELLLVLLALRLGLPFAANIVGLFVKHSVLLVFGLVVLCYILVTLNVSPVVALANDFGIPTTALMLVDTVGAWFDARPLLASALPGLIVLLFIFDKPLKRGVSYADEEGLEF